MGSGDGEEEEDINKFVHESICWGYVPFDISVIPI